MLSIKAWFTSQPGCCTCFSRCDFKVWFLSVMWDVEWCQSLIDCWMFLNLWIRKEVNHIEKQNKHQWPTQTRQTLLGTGCCWCVRAACGGLVVSSEWSLGWGAKFCVNRCTLLGALAFTCELKEIKLFPGHGVFLSETEKADSYSDLKRTGISIRIVFYANTFHSVIDFLIVPVTENPVRNHKWNRNLCAWGGPLRQIHATENQGFRVLALSDSLAAIYVLSPFISRFIKI